MSLSEKQQRAEHCNQAIRVIADHGRRFFFNKGMQRYASIEVDGRGRIWWVDDYSSARIYLLPSGFENRWRGFSHGGTLRNLVEQFRDYIRTGKPLPRWVLGPERSWSDGNIWGYPPEEMKIVREMAGTLPCFAQPKTEGA